MADSGSDRGFFNGLIEPKKCQVRRVIRYALFMGRISMSLISCEDSNRWPFRCHAAPAIAAPFKILTLSVLSHSGSGDHYSDCFFLHSVIGLCLRLPDNKLRR